MFAKAGLESPVLGSIIVGSVNVAGTMLAATLMDKAGRRQLLLTSHIVMAVCLSALAVSTYLPCASACTHWWISRVLLSKIHTVLACLFFVDSVA